MTGSAEEKKRLELAFEGYYRDPHVHARWDFSNAGNRWIGRERDEAVEMLLRECGAWPPQGYRILDIGCGSGARLAQFGSWGARSRDLVGVDLVHERLEQGRMSHPDVGLVCSDGSRTPFPDAAFGLVLAFTLFSTVLDPALRAAIATEVDRLLRPSGSLLFYDQRVLSPRNPHSRPVSKRELSSLFPDYDRRLRPITVVPPVARRLGRLTNAAYPLLRVVRPLRTHYIATLTKPGRSGFVGER